MTSAPNKFKRFIDNNNITVEKTKRVVEDLQTGWGAQQRIWRGDEK